MNMKFKEVFGTAPPTLPLQAGGNIVHGNAIRLDWEKVCPKKEVDEIYVLGNPPYLGARMQNEEQKSDIKLVCANFVKFKVLDYVACWFIKATEYIKGYNSQASFVSTNSICQGEQVALLWKNVINKNIE